MFKAMTKLTKPAETAPWTRSDSTPEGGRLQPTFASGVLLHGPSTPECSALIEPRLRSAVSIGLVRALHTEQFDRPFEGTISTWAAQR